MLILCLFSEGQIQILHNLACRRAQGQKARSGLSRRHSPVKIRPSTGRPLPQRLKVELSPHRDSVGGGGAGQGGLRTGAGRRHQFTAGNAEAPRSEAGPPMHLPQRPPQRPVKPGRPHTSVKLDWPQPLICGPGAPCTFNSTAERLSRNRMACSARSLGPFTEHAASPCPTWKESLS